jgi:anti-anti-sigma factor
MGSTPSFTTHVEARNGVARLALVGELDMGTAPAFLEQLTWVDQDGASAVMLDLRDVTFVDSTGLRAFLQAYERAKTRGYRLILVGANEHIRRLFALTRTDFLLGDEEAVTVLAQFTGQGRLDGSMPSARLDGHG